MGRDMNKQVDLDDIDEDNPVSLLDLLITIGANWRLLVLGPVLVGLAAAVGSTYIPPTFIASTSFIPPQQQNSSAALLQSLGALGGLVGNSAGLKNPSDQYVTLLKSRSLQSALVDNFKLREKYGAGLQEDALAALAGSVQINSGKDGLIRIDVSDRDPVFAAKLANAHVDELKNLMGRLALTEAQQRRQFFEKQLLQTKIQLTRAELELKNTGVNVSALKANPVTAIGAVAELQAKITAQQVKLSSLRAYATEASPEVKQTQAELAALQKEQAKITTNNKVIPGESDYLARYRDMKYFEVLFELFAKQFELAKVDEAREGVIIQVVDEAQPPQRRSKPNRATIVIAASMVTLLALLVFVFVRQAYREHENDSIFAEKFARLRLALR